MEISVSGVNVNSGSGIDASSSLHDAKSIAEPANNAAAPLMNLSFSIGIKFMKFAALSQCGRIYEIYIVKPYRRREDATRPKEEQTALSRGFNVDFDGKNSFFCVFIINLHTIR